MKPFFSIILPTYNQSFFLEKCINSILSQTFTSWELIIIDNYSNDNTQQIIEKFNDKRIKVIKYNNNNIIAKSRNLGIKNAISDWICFIDTDDIWFKNKLEITKKFIETSAGDLFYHDLEFLNKKFFFTKKKINDKSKKIENPIIRYFAYNGNGIGQSSVTVKKKILEKINFISEDQDKFSWEDFDTWIRISNITNNFVRIPKILASIWIGKENISNNQRDTVNSLNIKKHYKKTFYEYLDLKDKNKRLWWLEYPIVLNYFRKKNFKKCLLRTRNLTNSPNRIKFRLNLIRFICFILLFIKKIKSFFIFILIFKSKELPKNQKKMENCFYNIIEENTDIKELNFKNFSITKNFISRIKNTDKFHYLYYNDEIICYGWSSSRKIFLISEIDCEIKNSNNIIFYDFKTLEKYRSKGFYQCLLKNMLSLYLNKDCYIYTTILNKRSLLSILKCGFKFYSLVFFKKSILI